MYTNELQFTPKEGGRYIYSNNREEITINDSASNSNPNGSTLLFHDAGLTTGTYTIMVEHRNAIENKNIYLDIQFYDPQKNSKITITKYGDDLFGTGHTAGGEGKSWACMAGYAGFFGSAIGRVRSQTPDVDGSNNMVIQANGLSSKLNYSQHNFATASTNYVWLSQMYAHNGNSTYPDLVSGEGMYIMMEFEIESESGINVSIAAIESTGNFSTRFNNYVATESAPYYNDDSLKGTAEFMPETEAFLSFEVNDNTTDVEQAQTISISNPFYPNGIEMQSWKTHMNPQYEEWSAHLNVESDILPLTYYDNVKDKTFIFDTEHSADESNLMLPTPELIERNGSSNHSVACNMGNYGVKTTYKIAVNNSGSETRTFCYQIHTKSNIFLSVRDENDEYMKFYVDDKYVNAICSGQSKGKGGCHPITSANSDVKVELPEINGSDPITAVEDGEIVTTNSDSVTRLLIEIPAQTEKIFYIDEVLTTGDPGSIPTSISFI